MLRSRQTIPPIYSAYLVTGSLVVDTSYTSPSPRHRLTYLAFSFFWVVSKLLSIIQASGRYFSFLFFSFFSKLSLLHSWSRLSFTTQLAWLLTFLFNQQLTTNCINLPVFFNRNISFYSSSFFFSTIFSSSFVHVSTLGYPSHETNPIAIFHDTNTKSLNITFSYHHYTAGQCLPFDQAHFP